MDLDRAIELLESLGVYGAEKRADDSLHLGRRKKKRVDEKTGAIVTFVPEDTMTIDIRDKLTKERKWIVANKIAWGHVGIFRG